MKKINNKKIGLFVVGIVGVVLISFFMLNKKNNIDELPEVAIDKGITAQSDSSEVEQKQREAELLYDEIQKFLNENEDCLPEDFETVCIGYLKSNSSKPVLLNSEDFLKESQNKLILYRGISGENSRKYADQFLSGNIYIAKNVDNVRGNGIYTTSNYECATHFSSSSNGVIVTMFLNNRNDLLENSYLEELKEVMVKRHPGEFDYIIDSPKVEYIYNPINDLSTEYIFREYVPDFDVSKLDGLTQKEIISLTEELIPEEIFEDPSFYDKLIEKIKGDSRYIEYKKNPVKYFKDKKAALYYNSGLLAKLLGYNVLYTDEYDQELKVNIQEYLILDPGVITINTEK